MATVKKRKWTTGKGEQREAWVFAWTDAQGKRHKEQFPLKRDAEARRTEISHKVSTGTFRAEAATKTVKDAIDEYIKHLEARHSKGESVTTMYLRNTSAQLRTHVQPELGSVKLSQLTARSVNELGSSLRAADVGLITVRRTIGSLSRALAHAIAKDWVATNAAVGVRIIGKRGEGSEKVVPPTKAALTALLAAADDDMKRRIQFAAATGLRASEQWALRWRHLDLTGRKLTVETRVDAFGEFDTTKSDSGKRTVPLGKTTAADLAKWRKESKFKGEEDFVFPDSAGGFTRHTNFLRRKLSPLLEAAAEKEKSEGRKFNPVGWHALRHFAVSKWIEAGLQPKAIQTLAGHATYAITMDRYGHMFPSDDHANAMDAISETLFADGA
ncbi:integrase [Phyllobacterium sp. 1468]|uniref:tyrosine-type recombinase/integrase n=1 Tax=Phyllobacterium sp. 1468 TaxID=2817759 RepID=UPI0028601C60|nr:site-specific integrase [Phyllobacterium sp. 1468]MDR6635121.1 integrase [Phyllobacterium sp. 1468]